MSDIWIYDKDAIVMFHGPIRTGYRSHIHEYNSDGKCKFCIIEGVEK